MMELLTIKPVTIYQAMNGSYVQFISDLDICNDGSGPDHDDPHHQSMTAYYSGGKGGGKYLHAGVGQYLLVPPQVRSLVPPTVMGCQGRVTNMLTGKWWAAVTGE